MSRQVIWNENIIRRRWIFWKDLMSFCLDNQYTTSWERENKLLLNFKCLLILSSHTDKIGNMEAANFTLAGRLSKQFLNLDIFIFMTWIMIKEIEKLEKRDEFDPPRSCQIKCFQWERLRGFYFDPEFWLKMFPRYLLEKIQHEMCHRLIGSLC